MSRPITFCGTSQSLFAHDTFWRFSWSTNGLVLTADQDKKSEMDVSKNLKRKNGSLLKKRGEFYSISATVYPRVIIHKNNVKNRTTT